MLHLLTRPIAEAVATCLKADPAQIAGLITVPGKPDAGDLALPCFQPAKALGRNPAQVASELALALALPGVSARAAGPFLNFTLSPAAVAASLLPALADGPAALRLPATGQTVCVDFSSPNIAKHLAFHHIRSTGIGQALANCYAAAGWKVVRINFLGDWGTAFGRLIAGWKREGLNLADLRAASDPVAFLNDLYVRISRQGDNDPTVAAEARAWSRKCEENDPEALELWQAIRDASLEAAKRIYRRLGITFDDWNGEAHYRAAMGPVVAELKAKNLLKEDQGAQVVDLSSFGMKKPCLILRSDGGSLYTTRDLAACDDRHAKYGFTRCLYEVDMGQSLHFKEWFAVARLLGRPYADGLRHVAHGLILMWSDEEQAWAKTATRKGVPMMLSDVLDEAVQRAAGVVAEKNPDLPAAERAQVAEAVGLGAVLFNNLKSHRTGDVKFRFEDALAMQGDTGPYLQYTHARLCSILRKAPAGLPAADPARLGRDDEKKVLLRLAGLPRVLATVVDNDDPSQLATGLLDLAGTVSAWLTAGNREPAARVLCDDSADSAARLALVRAARDHLGEGLRLLGLIAPERM